MAEGRCQIGMVGLGVIEGRLMPAMNTLHPVDLIPVKLAIFIMDDDPKPRTAIRIQRTITIRRMI